MKRKLPPRVHRKAQKLMSDEGKSRSQAYGMAAGMNRDGRLTEGGDYVRAGKKKPRVRRKR